MYILYLISFQLTSIQNIITQKITTKGIVEVGWNQHSIASVSNWLKNNKNVSNFNFNDLKIDFDLSYKKKKIP